MGEGERKEKKYSLVEDKVDDVLRRPPPFASGADAIVGAPVENFFFQIKKIPDFLQ